MKKLLSIIVFCLLFIACRQNKKHPEHHQSKQADTLIVKYAKGFSAVTYDGYKILKVNHPFPKSEESFTYLLIQDEQKVPDSLNYDAKLNLPIHRIIVTSTTHIPSLVELEESETLVGFPHLDFISSPDIRKLIKQGKINDIGENDNINTEVALSLQPDALIGFSMNHNNKAYERLAKSDIPIIYNGDWNETSPLGKAEWIKFFGVLYNKENEAAKQFKKVEKNYLNTKKIATETREKPSILTGAMFKDVWYLPKGESWNAQFIADAYANYIYKDTKGTGSLSLSIESVLSKAQNADFWIAPSGFSSYQEMLKASKHYEKFKAFKNKKVYTYALEKGETGGYIYFELGPSRPDLVLKDLVHIFHPELLPDYKTTFFKPLR